MRGSYLNDPCPELRTGEPDDDLPDRSPLPEKGGPEECLRPCVECHPGHHFSDAMIETAQGEPEAEPAKLGVPAWYICKHCPAWRTEIVVEDLHDEDPDDDLGPDDDQDNDRVGP